MNLATLLAANAKSRPELPAIVTASGESTHREVFIQTGSLAARLAKLGIDRGSRVGLCLSDSPVHLLLHYAIAWRGAIIVPLDHRWTIDEILRVARAMRVDLAIDEDGRFANLEELNSVSVDAGWLQEMIPPNIVEADDLPLLLSLSSGTTGRPTGAIVSHRQLYERFVSQWVTMTFNAQDRFLLATPLYFGGGRSFAMSFLAAGATVILTASPNEPDVLIAAARDFDATIAFLVPTQVRRILSAWGGSGPAFPGLRLLVTSGSAIHAEERAKMISRVCPRCMDYYASSEGGGIAVLQPHEQLAYPQSVGRPTFRVEVAIVDQTGNAVAPGEVGRLRYRGPGVSLQMVDAEGEIVNLAAGEGWFEPGDFARMLPSGHLVLAGRAKDVIIRGGVNIYPAEVEAALAALPGVLEVIVVGLPDREFGEKVGALVVTDRESTIDALRDQLSTRLAPYKIPNRIVLASVLPRTGMNKPDRSRAREIILAG